MKYTIEVEVTAQSNHEGVSTFSIGGGRFMAWPEAFAALTAEFGPKLTEKILRAAIAEAGI